MKLRRTLLAVGAIAAASALGLSGCSSGGDAGGGGGKTVEILGGFTDAQATAFQADLDKWSETSGITATYTGTGDFQTAVVTRVTAGDPPDIAIYPQPGVLKQQTSSLLALDDLVDVPAITADEAQGLPDIAKVDGKTYGLPYSVNVKSLVWYNPAAFAKAGYTVPTTDAEMMALTDKIKADGAGYPWCVGIESGSATGWGATDWLEEYVLRYGGLDTYNDWITHKVKFDSDVVKKAGEKFADIALTDGNVNGGGPAIATTNFGTAGNQLFVDGKSNGQCFMMRQGTFIADFFPDTIKAEIAAADYSNVDVFPLPTPTGATTGALGGGDLVGAFTNDDSTKKVLDYLVGPDFGTNGYASQAIFLSPHGDFDTSLYQSKFQTAAADVVAKAEVFGFDASDQMPGAVGSGTEWTNLTEWVTGQKTLDEALKDIDSSWPAQ
ncbi:MAG: carbohydrate ABC transporter substrate-binding protein [Burkholderiaceae bacterium]|nr:carbohydrate ABC transporter substrate-binding protein [Microbacteriaceae bacterium]